jgi:chromosome segregation ATPase
VKTIIFLLGALSEEFQSRVEVIGEQFGGIMRKLEEHDDRFEQIDRKLKEHDEHFVKIDNRLDKIDKMLNSHTEMIGTLMVDMTGVKDSLTQKVDKKEFNQTINSIKVALASK